MVRSGPRNGGSDIGAVLAGEVRWLIFREADAGRIVRSKVKSSNSSTGHKGVGGCRVA